MGYLINTGTGFLAGAITTAPDRKSYIIGRYTSASLENGIGGSGDRIYNDGGSIENYTCAAASINELIAVESPTQAASSLYASAISDGAVVESVECFYNSYKELENIDIA